MSGAHESEQIFGIWTHLDGRKVAAYARHNAHHRGYIVYDARTGRALTERGHHSVATVAAVEAFVPNDAAPARVEYVGERSNQNDPVQHEVPPASKDGLK